MTSFAASMRDSLDAALRGLHSVRLYFLLLLSLAAWTLAYQVKQEYVLDLGGTTDDAYVSGYHAKERNPSLDYRWSGSESYVRFPGIGNEPVLVSITAVGFRPAGQPPTITLQIRGQEFVMPTGGEPRTQAFLVERGDLFADSLDVAVKSATFTPAGDARRLGVIVDKVTVVPASYGLRPPVIPPPLVLLEYAAGLFGTYLLLLVALRSRSAAMGAALIASMLVILLIVYARREGALLAAQLPSLMAWGVLMALLGRSVLDVLLRPRGMAARTAVGLGAAGFALAFLVRFGGATYPQFLSSDLLLHVHNVQNVLGGRLLFTEQLPDGTPVPYPNALYVTVAPLAALFGTSDEAVGLLLKWSSSLFDASCCLALAWAASHLWRGRTGPVAGGSAALVYAFAPGALVLLSAGNHSNIFGQAAQNWTLLSALVLLCIRVAPHIRGYLLLAVGFVLTMLGHYGMMLATLAVLALFALMLLWQGMRGARMRKGWAVVGTAGGALVLSVFAYYVHFTSEIWNQWSGTLGHLLGAKSSTGSTPPRTSSGGLLDFIERRSNWLGTGTLAAALGGAVALVVPGAASGALLVAWLLAGAAFALLDQVLGDTVRWYYLIAAPLALLAGLYLQRLYNRGRAGMLLAVLLVTFIAWQTLTFWVGDLIFTRYH